MNITLLARPISLLPVYYIPVAWSLLLNLVFFTREMYVCNIILETPLAKVPYKRVDLFLSYLKDRQKDKLNFLAQVIIPPPR